MPVIPPCEASTLAAGQQKPTCSQVGSIPASGECDSVIPHLGHSRLPPLHIWQGFFSLNGAVPISAGLVSQPRPAAFHSLREEWILY
jgi:hypothetical protein